MSPMARRVADPGATGLPAVLVEVDPTGMDLRFLSQMRNLFGHDGELFASDETGLQIFELALLCQMEGFIVTLNPRLQLASAPRASEQSAGTLARHLDLSPDDTHNVPKVWSFLSLYDRDAQRIPMAVIDIGFAPNPDFRGYDGGPMQEQLEALGVRTFNLNVRDERDPRSILRARELVDELRPDIVHTHLLRADLIGGAAARWAGVPVIISTAYALGEFRREKRRRSDRLLDAACARLLHAGCQWVTTEMAVFEWMGEAATDDFRALAPLFR